MATQTDKPRPIRALDLAASGDLGTQTPVRRKFDQWMKKVNAAKTELTDWDAAQTAFSESFVALIEPLRALRLIHYGGWLSARYDDPAFPRAFPFAAQGRFWEEHLITLEQQVERL